jgi:hypothetical protein
MATSTSSKVENQAAAIELQPLLEGDDEGDKEDDVRNGSPEERPRIGEIPSVHKPGYGNWMWAEQLCARRCGFSIAEAKLVQEAYELYYNQGDPKAFLIGNLGPFFEAFHSLKAKYEVRTANARFSNFVSSFSPNAYLAWTAIKFALSDFRDVDENRLHFMETLSKLLPIVMEAFDRNQTKPAPLQNGTDDLPQREVPVFAPTTTSTQQPPMQDSVSVELEGAIDPRRAPVKDTDISNLGVRISISDQSSPVQQLETLKKSLEAGHFDLTKLDEKKFRDFIQELLNSRSLGQMRGEGASGYIVIGWFARGSLDPRERLLRLRGEAELFTQMRKTIRSVRGWRRFLSLKSLHSFGLYKVSILK